MTRHDPREAIIVGKAARHVAAMRFRRPGSAPQSAAALLDGMRARNMLRAERRVWR